jgi:hypothetical protein
MPACVYRKPDPSVMPRWNRLSWRADRAVLFRSLWPSWRRHWLPPRQAIGTDSCYEKLQYLKPSHWPLRAASVGSLCRSSLAAADLASRRVDSPPRRWLLNRLMTGAAACRALCLDDFQLRRFPCFFGDHDARPRYKAQQCMVSSCATTTVAN